MYKSRQRGFTLVEIAIVLVIIGLLLGGILKGQQLISSARVRNMADQNTGIQAAYFGFIDRYRQIPGDMPPALACSAITSTITACGASPFGAATVGGNQNGRIDSWVEAGAIWAHLSAAGFINGTYPGVTGNVAAYEGGVLSGNVPGNAFQQPIFLGYTDDYDGGGSTSTVRLAYAYGAGVTASLLRELDVKLDDGAPGTGVVRSTVSAVKNGETAVGGTNFGAGGTAGREVLLWNSTFGPACVTNPDTATATYNVDSDNTRCNAVYLY
ncbi:MAG: prepilin-type N-terminal cleavage/methylation domain-containing protein [Gammaproteobacteria bacterium]|nr:MAG: prepilin-type N-terminal cleavage/methylation domain-containing protein [Gammaproteobacteria bacterium]